MPELDKRLKGCNTDDEVKKFIAVHGARGVARPERGGVHRSHPDHVLPCHAALARQLARTLHDYVQQQRRSQPTEAGSRTLQKQRQQRVEHAAKVAKQLRQQQAAPRKGPPSLGDALAELDYQTRTLANSVEVAANGWEKGLAQAAFAAARPAAARALAVLDTPPAAAPPLSPLYQEDEEKRLQRLRGILTRAQYTPPQSQLPVVLRLPAPPSLMDPVPR